MYSLRRRLLISATLLLVVFLGIMGVGLNRAFEQSVITSAKDALRNQVLLLISAIDVVDGEFVAPQGLAEPRLLQADSNLFAQVYRTDGNEVDGDKIGGDQADRVIWRSPSLFEESIPQQPSELGEFNFYSAIAWRQAEFNTMTLAVEWETESGTVPFVIQVAEANEAYRKRLATYQRQVGLWLVFFGGALVVLLLGMLGWSLKPLERVRRQVNEIEQGQRQRFDENYPLEVNRLTQNLNQLLSSDEQRIRHQKEVLGNLAHSLKTPIAVLKGLPYSDAVKHDSHEQLSMMQNIIDYQLQSASTVGRRQFARAIAIQHDSEKTVRSLQKLYAGKQLEVRLNIEDELKFYGDQGDWMEIFGNLVENAFKWARSQVQIRILSIPNSVQSSSRSAVQLIVEDDGPGIDQDLRETILQRGVRLDSQTPGHGLGMHIVKGIVDAYAGTIDIEPTTAFAQGTRIAVSLN